MDEIFYVLKKDLNLLEDKEKHSEAAIIAPLDNLLWDRKLASKIFDFDYKWEVYTPVEERKYGYYVLPIKYKDRFIGRFEPIIDRKSKTLLIQSWWWEKDVTVSQDMIDALTRCFEDFVKFLNAGKISISDSLVKDRLNWIRNCV